MQSIKENVTLLTCRWLRNPTIWWWQYIVQKYQFLNERKSIFSAEDRQDSSNQLPERVSKITLPKRDPLYLIKRFRIMHRSFSTAKFALKKDRKTEKYHRNYFSENRQNFDKNSPFTYMELLHIDCHFGKKYQKRNVAYLILFYVSKNSSNFSR